jgi:hypothetical protein
MTHATITTELDLGDSLRIEVDGDYWRYEDEIVQDLTLCRLWVYEPDREGPLYTTDLLHGLDRPSRLIIERNLFKLPGLTKLLCENIAALGEDLHIEPDYDPKDY